MTVREIPLREHRETSRQFKVKVPLIKSALCDRVHLLLCLSVLGEL
jgi:hypothetical protein